MKAKPVTLKNPRTGEIWICDDYTLRRPIDGSEFVLVHRQDNLRTMWINLNSVELVGKSSKKSLTSQ